MFAKKSKPEDDDLQQQVDSLQTQLDEALTVIRRAVPRFEDAQRALERERHPRPPVAQPYSERPPELDLTQRPGESAIDREFRLLCTFEDCLFAAKRAYEKSDGPDAFPALSQCYAYLRVVEKIANELLRKRRLPKNHAWGKTEAEAVIFGNLWADLLWVLRREQQNRGLLPKGVDAGDKRPRAPTDKLYRNFGLPIPNGTTQTIAPVWTEQDNRPWRPKKTDWDI